MALGSLYRQLPDNESELLFELARRHQLIHANNTANLRTPGYRAARPHSVETETGGARLRVGPHSGGFVYLVISHEDVPAFLNWTSFRQWFSNNHLDASEKPLWDRTIVASVRDLEKLIAAGRSEERSARQINIADVLENYRNYRDTTPDASETRGFKDTLGNWALRRIPGAQDFEPLAVQNARDRLFHRAVQFGFENAQPGVTGAL